MESQPLVSVIIPTYNRPHFLERAIRSVESQSYKNYEILVIDDGSDTAYGEDICKRVERCTYFRKENGGISSARNFGVRKANGEFIAFLDDDDIWKPEKLEVQIKAFDAHPEVALVHSSAIVIDKDGKEIGGIIGASENKASKRSGDVFWNALGVWLVKSPTPMIRRSVFDDSLWFDETLPVGEDVDFYQRLFYKHNIYYLQEPLAYYRVYDTEARLSMRKKEYLGVTYQMLQNFKKMGVKGHKLRKVARHLVPMAIRNFKAVYPTKKLPFSTLDRYIRPIVCLGKIKKQGQQST